MFFSFFSFNQEVKYYLKDGLSERLLLLKQNLAFLQSERNVPLICSSCPIFLFVTLGGIQICVESEHV